MLDNKNVKFSCLICRRKEGDSIHGLITNKHPNNEKIIQFNREDIKEIKTKLIPISLISTKYNELKMPVCQVCHSIIKEITNPSNKLKEERINDSIFFH